MGHRIISTGPSEFAIVARRKNVIPKIQFAHYKETFHANDHALPLVQW
jgi:hypothetical protein